MLLLRQLRSNIPALNTTPFSLRNFVKHLQAWNQTPSSPKFELSPTGKTRSLTTIALHDHRRRHFRALTSLQQRQVCLYIQTLLQWNQKMNLTAVKDEEEAMQRHVEDSLAIIEPILSSYLSNNFGDSCETLSIVDVGSGAGLPGMILAIACPGWKLTLLESMQKRCAFLEHVVGAAGLSNVRIVRERAENSGRDPELREAFDVAVARAVAEMRVLAEYCLPLVRVGGLFVAAKGHDPDEEVERAERAISLMGGSLLQTQTVKSDSLFGPRTAIICLKKLPTPKKYPRRPGIPGKMPL